MPVSSTILPILSSRTLLWVSLYASLMALYAVLPVIKEHTIYHGHGDLPAEIHAALTLVLGWLLVFRTNTAYARWWEVRTLWGALVNVSRNIAIKTFALAGVPNQTRDEIIRDVIGFSYALRNHLREESSLSRLPGFENSSDNPTHVPQYLSDRIHRTIYDLKDQQLIDGDDMRALDEQASKLLDICGGCERIRKTRIAKSYRVFARQCVFLYLATFPWGIVQDFGVWTIPLTGIIAYFMLGLETVAEHVEEPFGLDEDDLDLDGLCETINKSVSETADRARLEVD